VVLRDARTSELDDEHAFRWLADFRSWWPAETDLRGWDAQLGWLHRGVAWYEPATGSLGTAIPLPHASQIKDRIAATLRLAWRGLG